MLPSNLYCLKTSLKTLIDKASSQGCGQKDSPKEDAFLFICLDNKTIKGKSVLYSSSESSELVILLGTQDILEYNF